MELSALRQVLKACGVVGAGGAGFPSYAKLDERADTLVLNCAECEPLFELHKNLLAKFAREILTALNTVREAVGAERVIIAIKAQYKETVDALNYYLPEFENTTLSFLPEIYPAGDEIVTIYETCGRVVKPGCLPISQGVIVYNVETMLNAYYAIYEQKSVTHKYVTVAGAVMKPQIIKAPLGMKLKDLVALSGGESIEDFAYLSGGVMTGTPAHPNDVVTKTTNAVLVLPANHPAILKRKTRTQISVARAMSSCCQCRSCTDLCSRHSLGYPIEPHRFMRAVSKGMDSDTPAVVNALYCSQCGLCEMYACPQGLSPRTLIGVARGELRQKGVTGENPVFSGVEKDRDYKKVPMKRLIARLGLAKYDVGSVFSEARPTPKEVKIKLCQHIGAPAVAAVQKGDRVKVGDLLGTSGDKLGADIHASIDGEVLSVTKDYIVIKENGGK